MELRLLWGVVLLGCVGWACGVLLSRSSAGKTTGGGNRGGATAADIDRALLLLAVLLPVAVLVASLPSRFPFSAGGGWGRGFFVGGLGAWLAAASPLLSRGNAADPALRAATICSAGLVAAAVPLLGMRASVIDAYAGVAVGWLATALVLVLAFSEEREGARWEIAAGAGFAVALCALAALGIFRDPLTPGLPRGRWSAVGLSFAATVPFALLLLGGVSAARNGRPGSPASLICTAVVAFGLLAGAGKLLSVKVVPEPRIVTVVVLGLVLGALARWMLRDASPAAAGEASAGVSPLAALLVASGFMVSFQLLQGFGVGLLVIAFGFAAAAFGLLDATEKREVGAWPPGMVGLFLFAVVLLLYRWFDSRWAGALRGTTLTDHYALFGFLAGAMLPGLLAESLHFGRRDTRRAPSILSAALAGALTLAAPAVIVVLWGAKCSLALLGGLALGGLATGNLPRSSPVERGAGPIPGSSPAVSLFAIAVALALVQWTGHLLPLSEMTRAEKVRLLAYLIAALAAFWIVADLGGRRRRQNPEAVAANTAAAAPLPAGGEG